jgi:molybdopterin synthase catalytic subunit
MRPLVRIQTEDFDSGAEIARLHGDALGVGAVASFIGVCRNRNDGAAITQMELEHYPGMTEQSIEAMMNEARKRFDIVNAMVIHRVGIIKPGEQIVFVAVSSAHRGVAFQACEFLMDYLKTQAPFWKKETMPDGTARWVDARVSDDEALKKWGLSSSNA